MRILNIVKVNFPNDETKIINVAIQKLIKIVFSKVKPICFNKIALIVPNMIEKKINDQPESKW